MSAQRYGVIRVLPPAPVVPCDSPSRCNSDNHVVDYRHPQPRSRHCSYQKCQNRSYRQISPPPFCECPGRVSTAAGTPTKAPPAASAHRRRPNAAKGTEGPARQALSTMPGGCGLSVDCTRSKVIYRVAEEGHHYSWGNSNNMRPEHTQYYKK